MSLSKKTRTDFQSRIAGCLKDFPRDDQGTWLHRSRYGTLRIKVGDVRERLKVGLRFDNPREPRLDQLVPRPDAKGVWNVEHTEAQEVFGELRRRFQQLTK